MKIYNNKKINNRYELSYVVDLKKPECAKLIEFLYKLDSSALDESSKNSEQWFGKKISEDLLEERYVPAYDTDENGIVFFKVNVTKKKFFNLFKNPYIATIEVEGLEFDKNKFRYSILVHDVETVDSFDIESRLDFIKCFENKKTKPIINDDVINNLADTDNLDEEYQTKTDENTQENKNEEVV